MSNVFDEIFDNTLLDNNDICIKFNFIPLDELFESEIGPHIQKIIKLQVKFQTKGQYSISKEIMGPFLDKIYNYSCPNILKLTTSEQQLYILYIVSNLFLRYNVKHLDLKENEYIERIYFINIINLCSKHLIKARRLIYRYLKNAYVKIEHKVSHAIDFYKDLYESDNMIIKNDVMQMFFNNLIYKFNPFEMEDIDQFYEALFSKILYFYLKHKISGVKNCDIDPNILDDNNIVLSERYKIYEEALYLSQIQSMCSESGALNRINNQYDMIKNMIIPNELQRLYLYSITDGNFNINNNKISLLKIHTDMKEMSNIKYKLPQIYRLLRSVQIISDNKTFLDNDIIMIKEAVKDVLYLKFKNVLNKDILYDVVNNISITFTNSLTKGEFIDMLTLTSVNLSGVKFVEQLKEFLKIVLSGLGEYNE